MKVVGTAGHIDHGKSTLVQRLTGIDPDQLEEEKRRGMTIDLGFAWLVLPSGSEVSVVDVPGHERFIKNMLAGASGIDVALLVVAADEGVMPQTREHLDIMDLLGIRHGVVALTKSDLVDEEWLALVEDDVRSEIDKTGLTGSPIVPVSAVSGQGIEQLVAELDDAVNRTPSRAVQSTPYLPVDRVFSVTGFGTVVAGTVHGGSFAVGQDVEVLPSGRRGKIRSMQSHKRQVTEGRAGDRIAVNLGGVERRAIDRGDVLGPPGRLRGVKRFDARIRVLPTAPLPLRHGMELSLHVGAAERTATVAILSGDDIGPGQEGWAQLRLPETVTVVPGQKLVLRLPAPARTLAGGEVVDVAPRHRRNDRAALDRLTGLHSDSIHDSTLAALSGARPRRIPEIVSVTGQGADPVRQTLANSVDHREIVKVGDWFLLWKDWVALGNRVGMILGEYHREHPLRPGMPREELRSRIAWHAPAYHALLPALEEAEIIRLNESVVALRTFAEVSTTGPVAQEVLRALQREPFTPPSSKELAAQTGASRDLLRALVRSDVVKQVSEEVYFDSGAFDEILRWTVARIREAGSISVSELRDKFGTSRKYALAFLEYLDAERITMRQGDVRVLTSRANVCV